MLDFIGVIREVNIAPEKYLGHRSLRLLRAYLSGYQFTHPNCHLNCFSRFQKYIETQYLLNNRLLGSCVEFPSSHHWSSIIDFFSLDEKDAYDHFIQHFNHYIYIENLVSCSPAKSMCLDTVKIKSLLEVIVEVSKFPELFLGKASPELLRVFLAGCGHGEYGYDTLLIDFENYVSVWSGFNSGQDWAKIICFITLNEDSAYDGFVQLFNNYLIEKGFATQPLVIRGQGDGLREPRDKGDKGSVLLSPSDLE